MWVLRTVKDGKPVQYALNAATIILGAGDGSQIRVNDEAAAPRHCQLVKGGEGFTLRHLSGDAGTFVNGKKIRQCLLRAGDTFQIGTTKFSLMETAGKPAATPAGTAAPSPARTQPPGRSAPPARSSAKRGAVAAKSAALLQSEGAPARAGRRPASGRARPGKSNVAAIAIGAAVVLGAIVGVILWLQSKQIDPEKIKAELTAEIERINTIPADDIVGKDDAVHPLLEKEEYKKYAVELRATLLNLERTVHEAAQLQREADKEVDPFFEKYEAVVRDPERFKSEGQKLFDELRSLRDRFSGTLQEKKLEESYQEVTKLLEGLSEQEKDWESLFIGMRTAAEQSGAKGDFAGALRQVNEFGVAFQEKQKPDLARKLEDVRESLGRQAGLALDKLVKQAKELAKNGRKDDARKLLREAAAGFDGVSGREKIDEALKEIK